VFGGVGAEGFNEALSVADVSAGPACAVNVGLHVHQVLVLRLQHEALHRVGLPCRMVEVK
jgi:hypothetical protein